MSKISLRKVLAAGVAVALGVTGFVGLSAPANAATLTNSNANITYSGTGLKMVEGTDFEVTASINSAVSYWSETASGMAHTSTQVYKYTHQQWDRTLGTDDNSDGDDRTGAWVPGTEVVSYGTSNTAPATPGTDSVTATYLKTTTLVSTPTIIKWEASSKGVITGVDSVSPFNTSDTTPTLGVEAITANTDVVYTPYVSNDDDNVRDADEPQGPALTINWIDYVEAEWVTTVTAVRDGQNTADLTVALTPAGTGWNTAQMDDDIDFQMYKNTLVFDTLTSPSSLSEVYSNAGTGVYTARAYLAGTSTTWVGALSAATTVSFQFAEKTVSFITLDEQASANIRTDGDIREGTKAVALTATVRSSSGAPVERAGIPVSFFVSSVSNTASEITFNGTRVTHLSAQPVEIKTVTDAKGVATLNVANSVGKIGDAFDVYANVIDSSGTFVTTGSAVTYDWVAAVATNLYEKHDVGANDSVINSTFGKSFTLEYSVTDNFGQPYTGTDARIDYEDDWGDADVDGYAAVVNGKASITIVEAQAVEGSYQIEADLEVRVPNTNNWNVIVSDLETDVYVVVNNTPGKLDVNSSSSSVPVNYSEFENNNFELVTEYNTLYDGVYDPYVTLTGTVVDSNGVELPGAPVTLRGNGIFFDRSEVELDVASPSRLHGIYSLNSITVYADSNGDYQVYFASQKSAKQTITATSGSASATESLTVLAPSYDFAYDVKVTGAPKSVSAGNRVLSVSFAVVDYWGNTVSHTADVTRYNEYQYFYDNGDGDMYAPFFGAQLNRSMIDFSVYSDKGLILAQSPVAGDLAVYTARVLLQARDLGPTTVGINWGADLEMYNGGTFTLNNSATVWSGPAVNATAGAKKGRVVVEAYRAVGRTVTVTVGKTKTTFVPNKANDKFVVKGIKKGNRNVTVTISGIGYDFKKSKIAVK